MSPTIEQIERASARAMPAPATTIVHGWLASASLGAMARVNSASTLGLVLPDPGPAVAAVERWYRKRGLPPAFRLTDLDRDLDDLLARRGYRRAGDVVVMVAPASPSPDLPSALDRDGFLAAHADFTGEPAIRSDELALVIDRLALPHLLACRREERRPVAVGRVVADGELSGLFDLAVDPARRRQRQGTRLTAGMVAWAAGHGSGWVYLQVTADNLAGLALYRSLGFTERYRYHRQVAPFAE